MISRDIWWLWALIKLHSGGVKSSEAESQSFCFSADFSRASCFIFLNRHSGFLFMHRLAKISDELKMLKTNN